MPLGAFADGGVLRRAAHRRTRRRTRIELIMKKLAVLGYHKIGPPSPGAWETWFYVSTATFERQMKQLRDSGWTVIDVATLLRALSGEAELPDLAAMVTFDDGFVSVLQHAVPILRALELAATIFVPTQHVGSASNW